MPQGLNWQPMELPFGAGLQQSADDRARPQPYLALCRDAQFDEVAGLQTRLPYAAMSNSIFGGGTLSNCRKLAVVNGELCVFTDTTLYSWNAQLSAWVSRGTHLAVAVTETPRFATTGDQIDGDRAEQSGTVVYAWVEGTQVYAAAMDKATGSVLVSPTAVSTAIGRPRLVALATKILFFVEASATLLTVRAIDPAAPGTAISGAGTTVLTTDFNLYYDVVRAGTQDLVVGACRRQTTTSYTAFTVTPALSVTTSTKARTCDGPIAVSAIPDGTKTQIVRANSTNIQGDLLTTSTLADVFTAQAIGTADLAPVQLAAAHRSVQNGGAFRCYAFWNYPIAVFNTPRTRSNWVDTANSLGTQALFAEALTLASRAFDYAGSVYVWLAFGESSSFSGSGVESFPLISLQNSYFLYRDDAFLSDAKTVVAHGGGSAPSTGRLPGVALTAGSTTYSWCAAQRRRFDSGGVDHVNFAARAPVDVTFAFDNNWARRCARLGSSLYVAGGEILQYDGTRLVEVGFHLFPWNCAVLNAAGGSVVSGVYAYKVTWRYENGAGETERSTTATTGSVTVSTGAASLSFWQPLVPTHKLTVPPEAEVWRTAITPGQGAPFFKVSSNDPTATSNPNRYVPNDPTSSSLPTFNDFLADTSVTGNEINPENETTLESLPPPPASIIIATDTRLFLAGVAGDPNRVWYSRERGDGEVASFHDALTIDVPRPGGDITAIWFQAETLYVARQTALYALPGSGLDNNGEGPGFGPARIVSLDVGAVSQESVALTPLGTIFQSRKGWQLLGRDGVTVEYVGDKVSDFDTDTVLAVQVVETQHHVRILTSGRMIVWDFRANQWGEWTVTDGIDSIMWNGSHVYLTATGPKVQQATYTSLTYGLDVEEAWIKPAQLHGAVQVRRVQPLGEYRSAFLLRLRMKYDYSETVVDDIVWSPSPTVVGGPLQMTHGPKRRTCQAFKVRLTAVAAGVQATLATGAMSGAITTSGTAWTATWAAKTGSNLVIGELGNTVSLSIGFESGTPNVIDVRDHLSYDPATGLWSPDTNNAGVRVVCSAASLTVAALETAIAAGTALVQLSAADATPSKTINAASMAGHLVTGQLSGGTFTSPTGEALKLSGLGLEVGLLGGLYKRLAPAQGA